ncbi:hypothetical protein [Streptomyces sp. NPDC005283]|uniref:hypothetical protein n=1 Tax=Streptomyces sp. NPDC005283 TaxID=3156871 RepID=UPI003451B8AF
MTDYRRKDRIGSAVLFGAKPHGGPEAGGRIRDFRGRAVPPGYSALLVDDLAVEWLSDLQKSKRLAILSDKEKLRPGLGTSVSDLLTYEFQSTVPGLKMRLHDQ